MCASPRRSYVHLLVPFGALVIGAAVCGEGLGLRAVAGAPLVSAGLFVVHAAPAGRSRAKADGTARS